MYNNNRRNNRNPRRRNRGGNASTNNALGVSRSDNLIQRRSIATWKRVAVNNASNGNAFGIGNVSINHDNGQSYLKSFLSHMANIYEQYRVRRVRVYAVPGDNFTNTLRMRSTVLSRVDRDAFKPGSTTTTLGYLSASSNTKMSMLSDLRPTKLGDFQPCCHPYKAGESQSDGRIMPNVTWMSLRDDNSNLRFHLDEWHGMQVALIVAGFNGIPTNAPTLGLRICVDYEFRGRAITDMTYSPVNVTMENDIPVTYDLTQSLSDLKSGILTGSITNLSSGFSSINVGNIWGAPESSSINLLGETFRLNSQTYRIDVYSHSDGIMKANLVA
jgi:hypothetical protein